MEPTEDRDPATRWTVVATRTDGTVLAFAWDAAAGDWRVDR